MWTSLKLNLQEGLNVTLEQLSLSTFFKMPDFIHFDYRVTFLNRLVNFILWSMFPIRALSSESMVTFDPDFYFQRKFYIRETLTFLPAHTLFYKGAQDDTNPLEVEPYI